MSIVRAIAQLRTTDLDASIRFYVEALGMRLVFRHEDFYAGIDADGHEFHLKQARDVDPSIADVREGGHFHLYFETGDIAALAARYERNSVRLVDGVHDTAWQTREFVIEDDQGHTLYFGQPLDVRDATPGEDPTRGPTMWDFKNTSLADATFEDVNLASARFSDVNLAKASFSNVSLAGAEFRDVNLSRVAITDADLDGMTIDGLLVTDLLRAHRA